MPKIVSNMCDHEHMYVRNSRIRKLRKCNCSMHINTCNIYKSNGFGIKIYTWFWCKHLNIYIYFRIDSKLMLRTSYLCILRVKSFKKWVHSMLCIRQNSIHSTCLFLSTFNVNNVDALSFSSFFLCSTCSANWLFSSFYLTNPKHQLVYKNSM